MHNKGPIDTGLAILLAGLRAVVNAVTSIKAVITNKGNTCLKQEKITNPEITK